MQTRWFREQQYWNDIYRLDGLNHSRYVWSRHSAQISYSSDCIYRFVSGITRQRILSLGGGVDRLAVFLAKAGNQVVSVDISPVAAAQTLELARQEGVCDNLAVAVANGEEIRFQKAEFHLIVCKRSLHHMEMTKVLSSVNDALIEGGQFIAEEPICLSRGLRWIHKRFHFNPAPETQDERELTEDDVAIVQSRFREVKLYFFDLFARQSIAYFLCKMGMGRMVYPLGKMDYLLINRFMRPLRYLSSYAVIRAVK